MLTEIAADSKWGIQHKFNKIKNSKDFAKHIPIQTYESLKPYIDRILKGEQNVLWPSPINWFAKSSGTTADKSKFIPVSNEALEECHYKGGKDLIALYFKNCPETKVFSGKNLVIGGSSEISNQKNNIQIGDLSAVLIKNLPYWAEYMRVPDKDVTLMHDFEKKIDKIIDKTIQEDVRMMSGVPTWNIVMIKKIFEKTGKENLLEIWPNLELYVHGAVSFLPYKDQFKKIIPSRKMNYVETYNASEGFFAQQDLLNSEEMLLMLDYGVYYEFIPMEDFEKENPHAIGLKDVELNKNYALVISTNAGLWRYMIGDTIKFTSLKPFRIKITGRTKHFINAFGEEVIIDNAIVALKEACKQTGASIKDYTAGPVYLSDKNKGCHEWLIEFEKAPDKIEKFTEILDKTLQKVNSDYEAKRKADLALKMPLVIVMPSGSFYEWMKTKGKLGGQNKVPRLCNDRKYLDDILEFIKKG